jgi:hypothetical protein
MGSRYGSTSGPAPMHGRGGSHDMGAGRNFWVSGTARRGRTEKGGGLLASSTDRSTRTEHRVRVRGLLSATYRLPTPWVCPWPLASSFSGSAATPANSRPMACATMAALAKDLQNRRTTASAPGHPSPTFDAITARIARTAARESGCPQSRRRLQHRLHRCSPSWVWWPRRLASSPSSLWRAFARAVGRSSKLLQSARRIHVCK